VIDTSAPGAKTFQVIATDVAGNGSAIIVNYTVSTLSAPTSHLSVAGYPAPTTAGDSHDFTVTAQDPFGYTDTHYAGTIRFTSSDVGGSTILPTNYAFVASDQGVHTFNATLTTTGTRAITVVDVRTASITGTQSLIDVNPAPARTLRVAGYPLATGTGSVHSFFVTARDGYDNTVPSYSGAVHFTSTDAAAALPADYAFVVGDQGTHIFVATLKTIGVQSITASETTSLIGGVQGAIMVSLDSDGDGCPDFREVGRDWHSGGQRDPSSPWDFFDVPSPVLLPNRTTGTRDAAVTLLDLLATLSYIGTEAAQPTQPNAYGARYGSDLNDNGIPDGQEYDRTSSTVPGQPWRSGPPKGAVTMLSVLAGLPQVGTQCE
jgi:hypothetical protein